MQESQPQSQGIENTQSESLYDANYSGEAVMKHYAPYLGAVGSSLKDIFYGTLYQARESGYVAFESGKEDMALVAYIDRLPAENRKELVLLLGDYQYSNVSAIDKDSIVDRIREILSSIH